MMNAPIAALARYFGQAPKAIHWPAAGWNAALDVTLRAAEHPERLDHVQMPEIPGPCVTTVLQRLPDAAVYTAVWLTWALNTVTVDDLNNELAKEKRIRVLNALIDVADPDAVTAIIDRTNLAKGTLRYLWNKGVGIGTSVMYRQIAHIETLTNRDLYDVSISWYLADKALADDNEQTSRQTREKLCHDYLNWYLQQPEGQGSVTAKPSAAFIFGMALSNCAHLDDLNLETLTSTQTLCDLMFGPWDLNRERLCDVATTNNLWEGFSGNDGAWMTITAQTYLISGHPHLDKPTKERIVASLRNVGVATPELDGNIWLGEKQSYERSKALFDALFNPHTGGGTGHDGSDDVEPKDIAREFSSHLVRGHAATVGWLDLLAERFDVADGGQHHDMFAWLIRHIFRSLPYESLPYHVTEWLAERYHTTTDLDFPHHPTYRRRAITVPEPTHAQACAAFGDNYNDWHEYLQLIAEGVEAPTALLVATANR